MPNIETYTIDYDQGFPSFAIYTASEDSLEDIFTGDYNNSTIWEFGFKISPTHSEDTVDVDAIPCYDAINKYITDKGTRHIVLENFGSSVHNYVCPDLASYDLYKSQWLDFENLSFTRFTFWVGVIQG